MDAVRRGGDRQQLHEKIREHSMAAGREVKEEGKPNDLIERILADESFGLKKEDLEGILVPENYTGRSAEQVSEFLEEFIYPILDANKSAVGKKSELSV
jgi:adenylosuccinate lyase